MPYTRFDAVQLAGGEAFVGGPFEFAADEPPTNVPFLHFVLVQRDVVVAGDGETSGRGRWDGQKAAGNLTTGDAQAYGTAVLVRQPQPGAPPAVQTFSWTEAVTITGK
jgi:hypothetical protein